MSIADVVFQLY